MSEPVKTAPAQTPGTPGTGTTSAGIIQAEIHGRSGWRRILLGRDAAMIYVLIAAIAIAAITIPRFASPVTTGFLLLDVIPVLLIAMPMTLIIITGEIDLSVASIAGLTSALLGVLWEAGVGIELALVVSLVAGVVAGAFNGFLVAVLGLPSLAVTIGTLALFRGLALVVIGDNAVASFPPELTAFFTSKIGATGIPTVMIGVVIVILFFGVLLHFTPFGRGLYALGFSKEAARFVGINVSRAKFWLYVSSGAVSALAGIYWTLRYSSARSDNASGLELAVIAAVLLGGVSIFGGKGSIPGVVAGVLIIGVINYALRLGRVSDVVLIIVTGTLLIASVVAPSVFAGIARWRHDRRIKQELPQATSLG
jgi:rhamnose transport system permease protein